MAKRARAANGSRSKDVNYTIHGLLALVAIVLLTALFFTPHIATSASQANLAGSAYGTAGVQTTTSQAPSSCTVESRCEGTKLIHQAADCTQYTAFCKNGCIDRADGSVCK